MKVTSTVKNYEQTLNNITIKYAVSSEGNIAVTIFGENGKYLGSANFPATGSMNISFGENAITTAEKLEIITKIFADIEELGK